MLFKEYFMHLEISYVFDFVIINLYLFFLGIYGILINRRNIIIILLFFEIILLACSLNFLSFSSILDNAIGQIFSLYILTIAGSEVSLGLAFVILLFE